MGYTYDGTENLTAGEVFYWVIVDEMLKQLGVTDLVAAAMVLAGQPIITTRSKFGGATRGTSAASVALRRLPNIELRARLPTITGKYRHAAPYLHPQPRRVRRPHNPDRGPNHSGL